MGIQAPEISGNIGSKIKAQKRKERHVSKVFRDGKRHKEPPHYFTLVSNPFWIPGSNLSWKATGLHKAAGSIDLLPFFLIPSDVKTQTSETLEFASEVLFSFNQLLILETERWQHDTISVLISSDIILEEPQSSTIYPWLPRALNPGQLNHKIRLT